LSHSAVFLRRNPLLLASSVDRGEQRKSDARLHVVRLAEHAQNRSIVKGPHRQGRNVGLSLRSEPAKPALRPQAVAGRSAKTCPGCGAPMIAWTDVEHVDGELVELGLHRGGKREPTLAEKKPFLAELKALRKRGRKQGWAAVKFRERYGDWPSPQIAGV